MFTSRSQKKRNHSRLVAESRTAQSQAKFGAPALFVSQDHGDAKYDARGTDADRAGSLYRPIARKW